MPVTTMHAVEFSHVLLSRALIINNMKWKNDGQMIVTMLVLTFKSFDIFS